MSITFIADNSRSASFNYKGERSYSRTYIAESEDAVSEYDVLDAFTSSVAILSSHPDDALVKLKEITPDDEHGDYWEVSWEFVFDPDRHDRVSLLDQGFNKLDGEDKVKILDDQQEPVADPRLLDGAGGELPEGASPVFLEFDVIELLDFGVFS